MMCNHESRFRGADTALCSYANTLTGLLIIWSGLLNEELELRLQSAVIQVESGHQ
jgi:hypothetical protein